MFVLVCVCVCVCVCVFVCVCVCVCVCVKKAIVVLHIMMRKYIGLAKKVLEILLGNDKQQTTYNSVLITFLVYLYYSVCVCITAKGTLSQYS